MAENSYIGIIVTKELKGHHQADQYTLYGTTEEKKKKFKGAENLFEDIKTSNFPNLGKEMDTQI